MSACGGILQSWYTPFGFLERQTKDHGCHTLGQNPNFTKAMPHTHIHTTITTKIYLKKMKSTQKVHPTCSHDCAKARWPPQHAYITTHHTTTHTTTTPHIQNSRGHHHHSFGASISALSTPIFASKYAFCSTFRDQQNGLA